MSNLQNSNPSSHHESAPEQAAIAPRKALIGVAIVVLIAAVLAGYGILSRKSADKVLAERTNELEATQEALVDAERFAAMGKASAAIAHELKNALNGLGMCVELVLSDPAVGASVARIRSQIRRELMRLRDITESLLTFARTPRLERVHSDLHAIIAHALEMLDDQVQESGTRVELEFTGGGAPLELMCDGLKIEGVLINLSILTQVTTGETMTMGTVLGGAGQLAGGELVCWTLRNRSCASRNRGTRAREAAP